MTDNDRTWTVREWIFGLVAVGLGLIFSLLPRFMFAWCEFTEFGYLGRLPAFVVVGLLGAVAFGLIVGGGLMAAFGRPIGARLVVVGAGLGSASACHLRSTSRPADRRLPKP